MALCFKFRKIICLANSEYLNVSIQDEARALLFGVKLCLSRGYVNLHIEMDSLVLVHILK